MKLFVTGIGGFVGSHLRETVALQGRETVELVLPPDDFDVRNALSVEAAVGPAAFDAVLHLAAQSNVPRSFDEPVETFQINALGTVRLLQALDQAGFSGRFLYVSSGDVYGAVDCSDLPVVETLAPKPANPYAVSKVSGEAAALAWGRRGRFDVVVARPFNHVGARQVNTFSVARFAAELAAMRRGGAPTELRTGRLDMTRDFLDVRDVVSAYLRLLRDGRGGEIYNICSGVERRIADVLEHLIGLSGLSVVPVQDAAFIRPVDLQRIVGSAHKIRRDTGWAPVIPFEQTLSDLFASYLY